MARTVLIVSNDRFVPTAKSSEALAAACRNLGWNAIVRDSSHPRYLSQFIDATGREDYSRKAAETVRETFTRTIDAFDVDTVLSLDLQWLFEPGLFTRNPDIRAIHSFWFDDLRSWTQVNFMLESQRADLQKEMRDGKVTHHFNGPNQVFEGRVTGITNSRSSFLAAPRSYTEWQSPCEVRDRIAFIGNPGMRMPLPDVLMKGVLSGLEIGPLRQLCAETFAQGDFPRKEEWIKQEPTVRDWLEAALHMRVQSPSRGAVELLQKAGEQYPRAWQFVLERNEILEAALIIKMVNCCDRPAFVRHLYSKGLVDVFSNAPEWAPYGVKALPAIRVPDLPKIYQRYAVHLNAANALRDATANEKLFEIAACGRVSINLHSADVFTCYNADEVVMVRTLQELEEQARQLIANPERALAMGAQARERTLSEHLWEHRLETAMLAT